MKIIFLCSSLEPGKDGVGDYCRKLAACLIACGHETRIIALNDKFSQVEEATVQYDGKQVITVFRLPRHMPRKEKIKKAQGIVQFFDPDWLSFQYVPYGFDKKGMPFYLPKTLKQIAGRFRWHFMFHETWAGISDTAPLLYKIYGYFQKQIAARLIKSLHPLEITTTNILYQMELQARDIYASCLPLFSNIAVHEPETSCLAAIESQYSICLTNKEYYKIGIFGTSYPEGKLDSVMPNFISKLKTNKVVILSFGRNNQPGEMQKLKVKLSRTVIFVELGEMPELKVSTVMSILNIAVLCTPAEYIGKSGTYAALRLHNVAVAVLSSAPIMKYEKEVGLYNDYLTRRQAQKWHVEYIKDKFIALLKQKHS